MESSSSLQLAGVEIHGFRTEADLNIEKLLKEASLRWFRPNEVHAILSNHTLLKIQPQPVNLPKSGCVLLFDRKMLRNFRKDGHNWKKKKDGKTVQEAHEKLKIGNEERIHVYYARGEDDPSFYRRCYWLLDKNLERMVLVHYRHTSEDNAVDNLPIIFESPEVLLAASKMHHFSPTTNSISVSAQSDKSGSASLSEEINSGEHYANYAAAESTDIKKHEFSLHEINTLDWDDLVEHVEVPECTGSAIHREGDTLCFDQQVQYELRNSMKNGNLLSSQGAYLGTNFEVVGNQEDLSPLLKNMKPNSQVTNLLLNAVCTKGTPGMFNDDAILTQDSFEQWNNMGNDSLGLHNLRPPETVGLKVDQSDAHVTMDHSSTQQQIFCITDISPSWAYCTEETKVLVIGYFSDEHKHLEGCNIRCVIGGICVMTEMVQVGVYRCKALAQIPGLVDLYFSLDGRFPISQKLNFEYRSIPTVKFGNGVSLSEDDMVKCEEFKFQLRLAHLLFSTSNELSILSDRGQSNSLKAAKKYSSLTSPSMKKEWMGMLQASSNNSISNNSIGKDLLEMVLKNKLQQWLLEKIAGGVKTPARDSQGQGVIHLCARLDYSWSVRLFSFSGLSLDFRDAFGWTALHWAAYHGREKMVAALLSFGANPSMVTDPTPDSPGGCTAADLASIAKYDGLAAYLAEKGLAAHFEAMTLSGNITAPPQATSAAIPLNPMDVNSELLSEQDLCLKESLAAYRNAANAADRIQAAFRDRSLKLQTRAVQLAKPEMEAINIISAMKIQHAFRKFNRRKMMWAAANIQSHFRTWQMRKNYLNMRKQAIRIQAVFRGHQVRKQYHKVIWSVGVLEKAILRWRLKRRGLRGLQVTEVMKVDNKEEESNAEEEFYRVGREQAEDRVKRSVIRVQSMFRSYKAQQEYRRMKLAHEQAKLEYNEPQC